MTTDPTAVLRDVLSCAFELTRDRQADYNGFRFPSREWSEAVRNTWIASLRNAFAKHYHGDDIAIFGGRPRGDERREAGSPYGIREFAQWEFLYDVSVLKYRRIDAAYARDATDRSLPRQIPVVTRAIWLVESELARDGAEVVKDISKLQIGRSEHSLLIAPQTTQRDPARWLDFLGRAMAGIGGDAFVALVPTYASGLTQHAQLWRDAKVTPELYRCPGDGSSPRCLANVF